MTSPGYPQLDERTRQTQVRSDEALALALSVGYSDEDAWTVADRARKEARSGQINDTYQWGAGKASVATRPDGTKLVKVRTYTGNSINPLQGGLANASTQD